MSTNVLNAVRNSEKLVFSVNIYLSCMRENVTIFVLNAAKLSDKLTISKSTSLPSMREDVTTNVRNVTKLLNSERKY